MFCFQFCRALKASSRKDTGCTMIKDSRSGQVHVAPKNRYELYIANQARTSHCVILVVGWVVLDPYNSESRWVGVQKMDPWLCLHYRAAYKHNYHALPVWRGLKPSRSARPEGFLKLEHYGQTNKQTYTETNRKTCDRTHYHATFGGKNVPLSSHL